MSKLNIALSVILILSLSIIAYTAFKNYIISDPEETIRVIDSLESEIQTLEAKKESIQTIQDTIIIRIQENIIRYEKNSNTVINNNLSEDYLFFTDYLTRNKSRLDSVYNL